MFVFSRCTWHCSLSLTRQPDIGDIKPYRTIVLRHYSLSLTRQPDIGDIKPHMTIVL